MKKLIAAPRPLDLSGNIVDPKILQVLKDASRGQRIIQLVELLADFKKEEKIFWRKLEGNCGALKVVEKMEKHLRKLVLQLRRDQPL